MNGNGRCAGVPTVVLVAVAAMLGGAMGTTVYADESGDYQRVASNTQTPVEVALNGTILAQPDSQPRVMMGGAELQLVLRLWNRWDVDVTGRLPVDVVAEAGETYHMYRSEEGSMTVGTAYGFGPPHRRHRVGSAWEPRRTWSASYVLASVRDPMVQGGGLTVDVKLPATEQGEVGIRMPLSAALVVNDVTSVRAELTPAVDNVARQPRGTLSAVISVRWAWERFNISSAALFGEHGAPGGMALSGGWKWKRDG